MHFVAINISAQYFEGVKLKKSVVKKNPIFPPIQGARFLLSKANNALSRLEKREHFGNYRCQSTLRLIKLVR